MAEAPRIICLMGPTASGKSHLAMQWAQEIPSEIISVDSAMIYRGMDIGTAKPTFEDQTLVRHHLIDICDPKQAYSAAQFAKQATQLIEEILQRGNRVLLVGGTMLYFHTLRYGISELPEADPAVRAEILQKAVISGWEVLHQELSAIDPTSASRIHPHDAQRIQRALEIYYTSGMTLTELCQERVGGLSHPARYVALMPQDRSILHAKIERRFREMMDQGLLSEVAALHARGDLSLDLPSMRSVGYRQLWLHLEGRLALDEAVEQAIIATRQLAKRQITWLRSFADVEWL